MAYTTINKSTDYFNTKLYTGNNTGQSITGVGFKPDWVWIKSRSDTNSHNSWDIVRGVNKYLENDTTKVETTVSNGVTAFGTDGFTVGDRDAINDNNLNFASWNWLAGGGQGSSNTDGSINTTYTSVNTTAGFSISQYTGNQTSGASVGHGLGAVPKMILVKSLSEAHNWRVYHKSLGATKELYLDTTAVAYTATNIWNDQEPTSSVFYLGNNDTGTNKSGVTYVAYCFAEKTGYSKFGNYIGNDNSTFVYTGFKPKFLLLKNASEANGWLMLDAERTTSNPMGAYIYANSSNAEGTVTYIDFLSNGFRLVSTNSVAVNKDGNTFVYAAFGQSLVGSNNVPCTAR